MATAAATTAITLRRSFLAAAPESSTTEGWLSQVSYGEEEEGAPEESQ